METIGFFLVSLRPKQWVKNVFVFAPMIFSLHLFQVRYLGRSALAFLLFSLVAGGVYVINDVFDRNQDRLHPVKRNRPIAAGRLAARPAVLGATLLLLVVLAFSWFWQREFFVICLVYAALNLFYSLILKSLVIIDAMTIAVGFVLRLMAGASVNRIALSPWIVISTFLLAMFLALIKRRQELLKVEAHDAPATTRRTLKQYSSGMLDQMISVSTATTLIAYIMYVLSPDVQSKFHTQRLFYTVPFVIFGIFRYLFLAYTRGEGESPADIIVSDLPFTLNILLWIVVFILLVMS